MFKIRTRFISYTPFSYLNALTFQFQFTPAHSAPESIVTIPQGTGILNMNAENYQLSNAL